MSFWDTVTTGAQNAAETTKLVSLVSFPRANANALQFRSIENNFPIFHFFQFFKFPRTSHAPSSILAFTITSRSSFRVSELTILNRDYSLSLSLTRQRTKAQAEVMYFEQQIKQVMQQFGCECFPHMEQSNSGLVQQAFLNAQRQIEHLRSRVEERQREINELNEQIERVGR